MQHELKKTNTNTTIYDLFLYFKNLHALKNQICISRRYTLVLIKENSYLHLRKKRSVLF